MYNLQHLSPALPQKGINFNLQLQSERNFKKALNLENNKMGLLTLLRRLKKDDKEARILVLGLDNAGKVSIFSRLLLNIYRYKYWRR